MEEKKSLKWVPLYLAWDEEAQKVKMKVDKKENFAEACGLLLRISLETTKDILINEGKEREVKNESTAENE